MGDLEDKLSEKIVECIDNGGEKECKLGPGYYMWCPYNMCEGIKGVTKEGTIHRYRQCWLYQNRKGD